MQEELRGIQDQRTLTEMPGCRRSSLRGDTKGSTFSDRSGNRRPRQPARHSAGLVSRDPTARCGVHLQQVPQCVAGGLYLGHGHLGAAVGPAVADSESDRIGVHARDQHVFRRAAAAAVHVDRRGHRRPSRPPASTYGVTGGADGLCPDPHRDRVLRRHPGALYPGAVVYLRSGAGVRRPSVPVAAPVAGATAASTERDSAELDPVQPRPDNRPGPSAGWCW